MSNVPDALQAHSSNLTFLRIASHLNDWSSKTFGSVTTRGPIGPLEHLKEEIIDELSTEVDRLLKCDSAEDRVAIRKEVAKEAVDGIVLCIDVAFRCGIPAAEFVEAFKQKVITITNRDWPSLDEQDPDAPIYHKKKD